MIARTSGGRRAARQRRLSNGQIDGSRGLGIVVLLARGTRLVPNARIVCRRVGRASEGSRGRDGRRRGRRVVQNQGVRDGVRRMSKGVDCGRGLVVVIVRERLRLAAVLEGEGGKGNTA